ncbi:MAG TPA: peroxiredoxin [Candidatus Limnocylindria bacterium]|jgi:peroxiredoxin Q/BCP|nr:peroxiredoxin [Candidatus Limnocylindria bacterium]
MELRPGDAAPSFALTDENGKLVSNDSLKGKQYLVYFYPKDDTPGCTTEACAFNDNLTAFQRVGVPVLGVSRDDAASHRAFQKKFDLKFPLLSDPDRKAHEQYGAWGERPGRGEGVIRSTFLVDERGKVKKAWYGVKPEGHAQEVLAAIGQK